MCKISVWEGIALEEVQVLTQIGSHTPHSSFLQATGWRVPEMAWHEIVGWVLLAPSRVCCDEHGLNLCACKVYR